MRYGTILLLLCVNCHTPFTTSLLCAEEQAAPQAAAIDRLASEFAQASGGNEFPIAGRLFAADPSRIPLMLPDVLEKAYGFKAGLLYIEWVVSPAAKECVPTLLTMFSSDDAQRRRIAEIALCKIVDAARSELEGMLKDGKPTERVRAAAVLASKGQADVDSVVSLTACLSDRDAALRLEAAFSLLALQPNNATAAQALVSDYASQPDRILNEVQWLQPSPELLKLVLEAGLNDPESRSRRATAALKLLALPGASVADLGRALIEGIAVESTEQAGLAEQCIDALGEIPLLRDSSLPELARVADHSDSFELGAAASWAIVRLDASQLDLRLPVLLAKVSRPGMDSMQLNILHMLGSLERDVRVEATLRAMARREDHSYRLAAAVALLHVSPDDPGEALQTLRDGLQGKIKGSSGISEFENVGEVASPLVKDLIAALESDDPRRRRLAIQLLRVVGSGAEEALPALNRLLMKPIREEILLRTAIADVEEAVRRRKP